MNKWLSYRIISYTIHRNQHTNLLAYRINILSIKLRINAFMNYFLLANRNF